jgi:SAM-dependent methyltransferase
VRSFDPEVRNKGKRAFVSGRVQQRVEALVGRVPLGGPVGDFEAVGRLQLEVLVHEGLEADSKVLDVGCGCLRGGYWLIHFLDPGCYFGIEPHAEMLKAGLEHIVEREALEDKKPNFDSNDAFDYSVFDVPFDFVLARSIWTHANMAQIGLMLDQFRESAAPGAVMLASYFRVPGLRDGRVVASTVLSRSDEFLARFPSLHDAVWKRFGDRLGGTRDPLPADATETCLPVKMIPHRLRTIREACNARGLRARELSYGVVNSQRWLRIERV